MIDVEPLIVSGLDRLVPSPGTERRDWSDVVARARPERPARRRLVLAGACVLLALIVAVTTPVGAAIVSGLGDFSDWIAGRPGTPASKTDRERLLGANGHSWASFPRGTDVRQLIDATVGGERYTLFGFRSGRTVCLRLRALGHTTSPACTPITTLTHVSAPVVVVTGNGDWQDQHAAPSFVFSFGFVADGVRHVELRALDGTHPALVDGNAYLWVQRDPNTGQHALSVVAEERSGARATVPTPRFDFSEPTGAPPAARGPARVQVEIRQPTVRWFVRRQPRGLSPAQAHLSAMQRRSLPHRGFIRLVKPDPQSSLVVGLSQRDPTAGWCLVVVESGSACWDTMVLPDPIEISTFGSTLANYPDFVEVAGVVADGITSVRIFLPDGQTQTATLRDNLFTAIVPGRWPLRVAGYDAHGRVAAVATDAGSPEDGRHRAERCVSAASPGSSHPTARRRP